MSAIERRIADFLLENAHLLRDDSSQQLADALRISQSSVVKFSQKLGFKGYPDLKVSVSEAVARENGNGEARAVAPSRADAAGSLAAELWRAKTLAEEETRLINAPDKIAEIARAPSTARARCSSSARVRTACRRRRSRCGSRCSACPSSRTRIRC